MEVSLNPNLVHPFIFTNHFILVRATVDSMRVPENLWSALYGMAVHRSTTHWYGFGRLEEIGKLIL